MKLFNAFFLSSILLLGSCSGDEPGPSVDDDGCLTRWHQVHGAAGLLSWEPGKIKLSLSDPKADQWGLDVISTEVLYHREDEYGFTSPVDRNGPRRGSNFTGTELDMVIEWEDLQLQDSVFVSISLVDGPKSRHNAKITDRHDPSIGMLLYHNRAELFMPFTDKKVVPLPEFPENGQVTFKRRIADVNNPHWIEGTIEIIAAGVTDTLSYYNARIENLPFIGLYFNKDVAGTSSISITNFELIQVKEPSIPQDPASYNDDFSCNSTSKWDY